MPREYILGVHVSGHDSLWTDSGSVPCATVGREAFALQDRSWQGLGTAGGALTGTHLLAASVRVLLGGVFGRVSIHPQHFSA